MQSRVADRLPCTSKQVGIGWPFNVQIPSRNVIDSLIVEHDGHVGVLQIEFEQRVWFSQNKQWTDVLFP